MPNDQPVLLEIQMFGMECPKDHKKKEKFRQHPKKKKGVM
jgi:hypothetical protein